MSESWKRTEKDEQESTGLSKRLLVQRLEHDLHTMMVREGRMDEKTLNRERHLRRN